MASPYAFESATASTTWSQPAGTAIGRERIAAEHSLSYAHQDELSPTAEGELSLEAFLAQVCAAPMQGVDMLPSAGDASTKLALTDAELALLYPAAALSSSSTAADAVPEMTVSSPVTSVYAASSPSSSPAVATTSSSSLGAVATHFYFEDVAAHAASYAETIPAATMAELDELQLQELLAAAAAAPMTEMDTEDRTGSPTSSSSPTDLLKRGRAPKRYVPDELKDDAYLRRRAANTEAARRVRERKRAAKQAAKLAAQEAAEAPMRQLRDTAQSLLAEHRCLLALVRATYQRL